MRENKKKKKREIRKQGQGTVLCSWRGSKLGIGGTRTIRVRNGICQLALTGGKFDLKEKELEQNDHLNRTKSF